MENFHPPPVDSLIDRRFIERRAAELWAEVPNVVSRAPDVSRPMPRPAAVFPPGLPPEPELPLSNLYRDIMRTKQATETLQPMKIGRLCARIILRSFVQLGRDVDSFLSGQSYPLK